MTELLHAELTKEIIGVYYDVYNGLSRTYPEYIYEAAMMLGLEKEKGIPCLQTGRVRDMVQGSSGRQATARHLRGQRSCSREQSCREDTEDPPGPVDVVPENGGQDGGAVVQLWRTKTGVQAPGPHGQRISEKYAG